MATNRQTVVQPLGLVLSPNTYGQYPPGALAVAQNVVMRAPGELWQAPGFGTAQTIGRTDDVVRKLFPLDGGAVYYWARFNSPLDWTSGTQSVTGFLPATVNTVGLYSDIGQIFPIRMRERMLVNTLTAGALVLDKMLPVFAGDSDLRYAGMPQIKVRPTIATGASIPGTVSVAYSGILKRTFSDGYTVFSVPSPVFIYRSVTASDVGVFVSWSTTAGIVAGDIVEIYRTDGLQSASASTDPGETLKLVAAYTLTSTDISAGNVLIRDAQACQAPFYQTTGRELYTNPGQETSLQANRQPDICGAMAKFKSYAFFGDVTERPSWTWSVPAGVADLSQAPPVPDVTWFRQRGIGTRDGTGTVTATSSTITGISAADMVGLKVGQLWNGAGPAQFPFPSFINAVGTTSVSLNQPASVSGTTFKFKDVILLDGLNVDFGTYAALLANSPTIIPNYELTLDSGIVLSTALYTTGVTTTIEPIRPNKATMSVAATNGANYQPPIPEYNTTAQTFTRKRTPNLLKWSKNSEPEHVPPSNETEVGAGTIIAMVATKNALWIFATDGLHRLSGDTPPWRIDHVDPSCILVAPQALVQLRDTIYAYTNYSMTAITDTGLDEFTTNVLDSIFPGPQYSGNPLIIVERNELDAEIVVSLGTDILYVYNTVQKAWTYLQGAGALTTITALAFQRNPASGIAALLVGQSLLGSTFPRYAGWALGINYLGSSGVGPGAGVQYQPFYGADTDPLVMKQFVDETLVFNPADAGKTVTVTERGTAIASVVLTAHNSDAYGTVGFPRNQAIAQSSSPGFTMIAGTSQYKFRGISQRSVLLTDQAWRK